MKNFSLTVLKLFQKICISWSKSTAETRAKTGKILLVESEESFVPTRGEGKVRKFPRSDIVEYEIRKQQETSGFASARPCFELGHVDYVERRGWFSEYGLDKRSALLRKICRNEMAGGAVSGGRIVRRSLILVFSFRSCRCDLGSASRCAIGRSLAWAVIGLKLRNWRICWNALNLSRDKI